MPIGGTFAEIWPIFDFLRWRPSAILDLFYVYLDYLRNIFDGLCYCAKFSWNRCSSVDNMPVLMFCEFGLFTSLFGLFLGDVTLYAISTTPISQNLRSITDIRCINYACICSSSWETAWTKKVWRRRWNRRRTWILGHFRRPFKITPTWLFAIFSMYLCSFSVAQHTDTNIWSILLFLFLKGSPKFSPNHYT